MVSSRGRPPSTGKATPVRNDASSDSSHATAAPISLGAAKRFIICGATIAARRSAGSSAVIPVSVAAGQTALTRIPLFASSSAALRVRPTTACLLAE